MKKDYLKIAIRNIRTRPLRSWLTMFGIVIGVFLIMTLLSLSEGIKTAIMKQLRMMGSEILMVYPGELSNMMTSFIGGAELSDEDIKAIKKAEGVDKVIPSLVRNAAMRYEGKTKSVILNGVPLKDALEVLVPKMGWQVQEGRFPESGKREILIGALVPEEIFPGMRIGTTAYLEGRQFKVSGIMKSLGNKMDDGIVTVDLEYFREITGVREGAMYAIATMKNGYPQEKIISNIKKELTETRKRERGEDSPPFSVISSEKAMDMVGGIMGIIQAAIFAIASVAMIVGGIGIMNTMYTAVRERTKEIGIMKAVGAKTTDITTIFLLEAGIMGLIGGIGGTVLGLGGAKLVELFLQFHPVFYLEAYISPAFALFGLAFAFFVGCFSGYLPSRRAAALKPVDALRYE